MPPGEGIEVIAAYPVLASGELESLQVSLFDPAQDGNLADTAVPGHGAGGKIHRIGFFPVLRQMGLLLAISAEGGPVWTASPYQ